METELKQTGNISKFVIYSKSSSESVDVSAGVVLCEYYESILDNSVRFSIVIVDTGHDDGSGESIAVLQRLKLVGSEKVHVTVEDDLGNKLKFADDNALYIGEIRNIISSSNNIIYTLDLVSLELIADDFLSTEVYRSFEGDISQSAGIILKDILKTKKDIIIDATANKFNFIGQGKKPFRLLAEIATKGVSQSSKNSAGYLIYETYDGYNFRSIDSLFDDEQGYKSFIYNSTVEIPNGYDGKILSFDSDTTIDVKKNLSTGAYGSKLETFNTYTHIFNNKSQEIVGEDQKLHGGLEHPVLSEDFKNKFETDGVLLSKRFTKTDSAGELPGGGIAEQLEKQRDSNLILEDVILQSSMTYNKLFTLNVNVTVYGDYSLRAGSIVHCDFPAQGSSEQTGLDKEMSGLYIIADVCTHLTPKTILTKMHLVRDSYGRKPNKSIASKSAPDSLKSKGITGNSGRGLFGTGTVNPFSSSNMERYALGGEDLMSRLGPSEDSQTIDRTKYSNFDLDDNEKNFNLDEYLDF